MKQKVCPVCGEKYTDDSVFCKKCGGKLIAFEVEDGEEVVFNEVNDEDVQRSKLKQIKTPRVKVNEAEPNTAERTGKTHARESKNPDKEQTQEFDISAELEKMKPDPYGTDSEVRTAKRECPVCGAVIPAESRFCPACKTELSDNYYENDSFYDEPKKRINAKPVIIAVAAVAAFAAVVVLALTATGMCAKRPSSEQSSAVSRASRESREASRSLESSEEVYVPEPSYYEPEESYTESYFESYVPSESEYSEEAPQESYVQSSEEISVESSEAEPQESTAESSEEYSEEVPPEESYVQSSEESAAESSEEAPPTESVEVSTGESVQSDGESAAGEQSLAQ